jgi:hypothetical protein
MLLVASLLVAAGPGGLYFLGDEGCPEAAAVESRLRRIDPTAFESTTQQFALIEAHPRGLRVRLFGGQGDLLEDRLLEGSRSCAEWANAAAALLASWESEVGAPDLMLSDLPAEPWPMAEGRGGSRRRRPVLDAEIGLGPSGAIAGDGSAAFGGEILISLSSHAGAWGGQLTVNTTTLRSVTVGGGSALWQRSALTLGPYLTFGGGPLRVDLGLAVAGAVLYASGAGFLVTHTASAIDPGVDVTIRLRWDFSRSWRLWLLVGPTWWLRTEHAQVLSGQVISSTAIPSLDVLATLGLSFTFDL